MGFDITGIGFSSAQLVKITVNLVHIIRYAIISPQIINRFQLAPRGNETTENRRTEQSSYHTITYIVKQPAEDCLRSLHGYLAIGKLSDKTFYTLFRRLIEESVIRSGLTQDKLTCLFDHPFNFRLVT